MEEKKCDVAVIMGSKSDLDVMQCTCDLLDVLNISYMKDIVSAHRTPEKMYEFAKSAQEKGFKVIIAGAGGAAHLPGMVASMTNLPVLGVPMHPNSNPLNGLDSLLSIAQMPCGTPVATFSIGKAGAKNAALFAASILGLSDKTIHAALASWKKEQTAAVLSTKI